MESDVLYRISSRRNIVGRYSIGAIICIQVMITTEDRMEIFATKEIYLEVTCYNVNMKCEQLIHVNYKYKNGIYDIFIQFADNLEDKEEMGPFQIYIKPKMDLTYPIIFSFISDLFYMQYKPIDKASNPHLSCYRQFLNSSNFLFQNMNFYTENTYRIKEYFGHSFGSHVWDSAYVLSQYLLDLNSLQIIENKCILELGSGCGSVGISLASKYTSSRFILTDLVIQQTIIEENILLNNLINCQFMQLDWSNQQDIQVIKEIFPNGIDIIIASDVMYSIEALPALFETIYQCSILHHTSIYISQKKRSDTKTDIFNLTDRFICEKLTELYGVIIWKLSLKNIICA